MNHALDMGLDDWSDLLETLKLPKYRGKQIMAWIFKKLVLDPQCMTNIPENLRNKLAEHVDFTVPQIRDRLEGHDGTTKLLLETSKGFPMETVIMRYPGRTALCVSSQVGCRLACSFCQTGKMGLVHNLKQSEILSQLVAANEILRESDPDRKISHVVFMGMGEPLDNYDAAIGAANTMMDPLGFGLSPKHVTISTSGIVPKIERLATECEASFALSLHAARDSLRNELMPIGRRYPLEQLKQSLLTYQAATNRKITLEYILIKDKNCGRREVKELVKFIHGLKVKVNLIPFNSHPGMPYERPSDEAIREFQQYLAKRSIPAPVRYSKGLDVSAACGQLAAKHQDNLVSSPDRKNIIDFKIASATLR